VSYVDWTDYCNEIRDQGDCGSCTAFGATGAAEANFKILLNMEVAMSESDAFYCSGGKCEIGNYVEPVLDRLVKGVSTKDCSVYVDHDIACGSGRCSNWWETGYRIQSWKSIRSVDEMKQALAVAPLVGVMDVHQSFMNYISGVYHSLGFIDPILGGHCITIVGYDDAKGAWKLRNSWGTNWGMNGYCWIKYGDSAIDSEMWSIVPTTEKPLPEDDPVPPDPPTPSPCWLGNGLAKVGNLFAKLFKRKGRFYYLNP